MARSKTKREGPTAVTKDEAHDHFKRTVAGSKWAGRCGATTCCGTRSSGAGERGRGPAGDRRGRRPPVRGAAEALPPPLPGRHEGGDHAGVRVCFDLEQTIARIATSLGVGIPQVCAAVKLLDDDNTIPFIARYRKEATHGLDEVALRKIRIY